MPNRGTRLGALLVGRPARRLFPVAPEDRDLPDISDDEVPRAWSREHGLGGDPLESAFNANVVIYTVLAHALARRVCDVDGRVEIEDLRVIASEK
jgi:hypothetical protein